MLKIKSKGKDIMFDMVSVGRKISKLRKKANLTQMELADKLNISFQAVSNWERGQTMPDIAKLSELSDIFEVSIDELLQNKRGSKITEAIVKGKVENEAVSVEEMKEIAPLVKPDQLEGMVEGMREDVTLGDIVGLAPFLSQEFVDTVATNHYKEAKNVSDIASIAPFVSTGVLDTMAREVLANCGIEDIISIAPFISSNLVDELAQKHFQETSSVSSIASIAPFVSASVLDEIAKKALAKHGIRAITSIAPFLSQSTINKITVDAIKESGIESISPILPFVDSTVIEDYLKKE